MDTGLVLTALADLLISMLHVSVAVAGRWLRMIRLFRLMRTVRLFRALKSIREFHKMLYAILSSFRTLCCSLAILLFVIYFFAVLLCQAVTDFRFENSSHHHNQTLEGMYGSLLDAVYALFS